MLYNKKKTPRLAIATALASVFLSATSFSDAPKKLSLHQTKVAGPIELNSAIADRLLARKEVEVFIQLDDPSVIDMVLSKIESGAAEPAATMQKKHASMLESKQKVFASSMDGMGATHISSLKACANGMKYRVYSDQIAYIKTMSGVKNVVPVTKFKPSHVNSVPWIGTTAVRELGFDGKDVTIAVLDTGIDYFHKTFGGSGDVSEYENNDPSIIEEGTFPTAKVIGGFDLAGTNYDASGQNGSDIPSPDPDPLDFVGHGSHVSGSAAGGSGSDKVGEGVAPGAKILAVKVFGDVSGSSAVVSDGIEYALDPNGDGSIDDRADIINMSLGSDFGSPDDPTSIAATNASKLGVIVVAAAGNAGNGIPYILGSPAASTETISVAASLPGNVLELHLVLDGDGVEDKYLAAYASISPPLADEGPISGSLETAAPFNACTPLSNTFDGKIAFITRGACAFTTKLNNAKAAGASAVVVTNNADGPPITMGGDPTDIAGLMISNVAGAEIIAALNASNPIAATLSADSLFPFADDDDTLADFSSSGPSAVNNAFKPDITAPGVRITSAATGTGDGPLTISGTSMATPHIAGVTALMVQKFGSISPPEVKALLQNSSTPISRSGPGTLDYYPLTLQGTGRVQVDKAISLSSLAMPGGVSFGRLNPRNNSYQMQTVTVKNMSDEGRRFTVTLQESQSLLGASLRVPRDVYVDANSTATFSIAMAVTPALLPADDGFNSQTEIDGWVVLDDGVDSLRVGYMAVIDPASAVINFGDPKSTQHLLNWAAATGLAEGFTLAKEQGDELDNVPNAIAAFGYRTSEDADGAPTVEFAIAGEKAWNTFSNYEIQLEIDNDEDGVVDFNLISIDIGFLRAANEAEGQIVTALQNVETGAFNLAFNSLVDNNDRWSIFTVNKDGDLGILEDGDTGFDYTLRFIDSGSGDEDVQTGRIDFANEIVVDNNSLVLDDNQAVPVSASPSPTKSRYMWVLPNNTEEDQIVLN